MDEAIARLMDDTDNSSSFVVTKGPSGMSLYRQSPMPRIDIEAHKCHPIDVTGAGDCVASVIAVCLACGIELESAMYLANLVGAIAVSNLGTYAVGLDDILQAADSKVISGVRSPLS